MKFESSVVVRLAAVGSGAGAIALAAAGSLSYEHAKVFLTPYFPAGKAEMFTIARYSQAVMGTRALAVVLILLALSLFVWAVPIGRRLTAFAADVRSLARLAFSGLAGLRNEDTPHLAALGAILLWAVVLRLVYIDSPMRWDESDTFLSFASRPLFVGLTYYTPNNHLFQTLLMHLSYKAFGISPVALRIPVLLAGILVVPLTYACIRLYRGRDTSLLAAALACASLPLIEYSTNARGYSIGTAFFLLLMLLGVLGLRGAAAAWTVVPVAGALAIYSVPDDVFRGRGILRLGRDNGSVARSCSQIRYRHGGYHARPVRSGFRDRGFLPSNPQRLHRASPDGRIHQANTVLGELHLGILEFEVAGFPRPPDCCRRSGQCDCTRNKMAVQVLAVSAGSSRLDGDDLASASPSATPRLAFFVAALFCRCRRRVESVVGENP